MRTFILPSLIQNLVLNISTGIKDVRLFEVSRVFRNKGEALPEEIHSLGALFFREKVPTLWREDAPGFYIVKGAFESLIDILAIGECQFSASSEPFLHPGQSADILVSDKKIGYLGILHPDITETLSLKAARPEIVVLEINLDLLLSTVPTTVKYASLPRFPYIDRDISLIIDESKTAASVIGLIREYPSELIEDVSVFDFYKGKNIPEGKKSLAFGVRYRAKDRTLTDAEIEELHTKLLAYISEMTGGTVRGA